jgi:hypothetical protein
MQSIKCFLENVHFFDAFLGAFVAISITAFYKGLLKKLQYLKLLGKFYHGIDDKNIVIVRHIYGENFLITELKEEKIQWRGSYQRKAKGLLTGTYDHNFNPQSNIADWGEHHLRLLPGEKTISVLIKPLVPKGNESAISWHRK